MTTSTLTAALARHRAATAAEAAARAADEQADEHLRRGRQELTNAAAELERVRAALKGTDERRSRLIAEKIQSGEPLPPFAAVDSLDDEERRASRRHDQLQTAVARLEATKRSAAAARAEAAAELEDAVAEILAADGERLAAEVERDEAALARKRNLLSALADRLGPTGTPASVFHATGNDLHTPINLIRPRGDFNVPINELGRAAIGDTSYWDARLAELLASSAPSQAVA